MTRALLQRVALWFLALLCLTEAAPRGYCFKSPEAWMKAFTAATSP